MEVKHGSGNLRWLGTLDLQSGSREGRMQALSFLFSLFLIHSVWGWHDPRSEWWFSLLSNPL